MGKKELYRFSVFIVCFVIISLGYAQKNIMTTYPSSVKSYVEAGDKILKTNSSDPVKKIIDAQEQYKKAYEKASSVVAVKYRYAYTILQLKDKNNLDWALPVLWEVASNYPEVNDTLWFGLGYIYMEKWMSAQDFANERIQLVYKNYKDSAMMCLDNQLKVANRSDYVKKVEKAKKEFANAEQAIINRNLEEVKNYKEINSKYDDFNPQFRSQGKNIVYTSFRKDQSDNDDAYGIGGSYEFATDDTTHAIRFLNSYQSLLSSELDNAFLTNYDGNIYEFNAKIKGRNKIEHPIKPINTQTFVTMNATYADDGNTIYFASNCPKGFYNLSAKEQKKVSADKAKDFDIYKITRTLKGTKKNKPCKETWGKIVGVAPVNTDYDELLFMQQKSEDGTPIFYLISNNENSIGGYDIFSVQPRGNSFSKPVNMGYPINSIANETSFTINREKDMYLTSDRIDGKGCRDIYYVRLLDKTDTATMEEDNMVTFATNITDNNGNPVSGVNVTLKSVLSNDMYISEDLLPYIHEEQIDGKTCNVLVLTSTSNEIGQIDFALPANTKFDVVLDKNQYVGVEDSFTTPEPHQQFSKDFVINKFEKDAIFVLNNIFFDYDKYTLRSESDKELNKLLGFMQDNPHMEIELSGHTDSKGSDSYNKALSMNRAKAVVNWLVSHGISAKRLSYKGYGASKPIATNDTDEGRQLNRRVEFKIKKIQ